MLDNHAYDWAYRNFPQNFFTEHVQAAPQRSTSQDAKTQPSPFIHVSFHLPLLQLAVSDGRKKKSMQEPQFDYYSMDLDEEEEVDLTDDELSHIVEIYDFPTEFKTEDLLRLFQCYQYVRFPSDLSIFYWKNVLIYFNNYSV